MRASAPGKLFVVGEYAVLEGAAAVLTDLPRRAEASLTAGATGGVTSITDSTSTFTLGQARAQLPLLAAVLDRPACANRLRGRHLTLNTSRFFRDGVKLGLGSSAALTAALIKLLLADATIEEQYHHAMACHRKFQRGEGSGADIALSMMDRPIIFRAGRRPAPLTFPQDLAMLAIWTGRAAATTGYLVAMREWRQARPRAWERHINRLADTASACVTALQSPSMREVLATVRQYDRGLEALSRDSGVNFYNRTHLDVRKRVELAHCTYKPSGAGGGDFGIAFGADRDELVTLAENLKRQGAYAFFLDSGK